MKEDLNITVKKYLDDLVNNESVISRSIPELLEFYKRGDELSENLRFLLCLNLGKAYCIDGLNKDLSLAEKFLKEGMKFPSQIKKEFESELFCKHSLNPVF